jgi:hypothetical protein
MKKFFTTLLLSLALFMGNKAVQAQTTLVAGDLAFLGELTDSDNATTFDGFTFITLKALSAGTVVYFTDCGWNQTIWTAAEGHITWTTTSSLPVGTIVNINFNTVDFSVTTTSGTVTSYVPGGSFLSFPVSGDQILAYQGSGVATASPTFIAAIDFEYTTTFDGTDGWSVGNSTSSSTYCSLPPGLTNMVNCVSLVNSSYPSEYDNFKYTGTLTGTVDQIRAAINNRANWTGNDDGAISITSGYATVSITASAPAVTSVTVPTSNTYKIGDALNFTVNYDQLVNITGTPRLPITLNTGGTVNASYVSGSGSTALVFRYFVASGNLDADGIAVGAALSLNGGTIKNDASTDAALNLNSVGTTSGIKVDGIRPTATIAMSDAALRVGETSTVTFTFSEAVTGFTTADVTVENGTLTSVSSIDGGITWTATFTPSASVTDATNVITLDNTGISDSAGNAGTGTTTSGNYAIDTVNPSVSITSTSAAVTYTTPIPVTVTFSETVSGFSSSSVTVTNGTVASLTGSGASYTANITPSGQGLVTVAIAAGVAQDAAGNNNTAATSLTRTFDSVNPTVTLSTTASQPTNSAIPVTVTFSEDVTGLALSDFTVTNATLGNLSGSGKNYTRTATPAAQSTVSISLPNASVLDVAQLGNVASNQLNRTFDNVAPTVSINSASASATNASPIAVTITFSESVTGFVVGDVTVTNGAASGFAGSGTAYTVNITPSGQGLVTVAIAAGVAQDAAGNLSTAATSLTRTFDNEAPTIGGVTNGQSYTSAQAATFAEGTATLAKDNGVPTAYTSGAAISSPGSYVVTVTDVAGNSNSVSFTITISTRVDEQHKTTLLLYPNPCTAGFNVSGINEPAQVTITDLTGRVVVKTMVDVDGYVPVGHLEQGTYLVKVNQRVLKLIKK